MFVFWRVGTIGLLTPKAAAQAGGSDTAILGHSSTECLAWVIELQNRFPQTTPIVDIVPACQTFDPRDLQKTTTKS